MKIPKLQTPLSCFESCTFFFHFTPTLYPALCTTTVQYPAQGITPFCVSPLFCIQTMYQSSSLPCPRCHSCSVSCTTFHCYSLSFTVYHSCSVSCTVFHSCSISCTVYFSCFVSCTLYHSCSVSCIIYKNS
jgi:hypothetical protein